MGFHVVLAYNVDKNDLGLLISLPPTSDYRCVLPCLIYAML